MEAEAENELGQMSATVWDNTIKPIRVRAGFTESSALDFPSADDPTVDNGFLRLTKRTFNPQRDYLWAIPQSQMDLDPNLTQNPGY
jgi:hypothetical protein